jgi:carbamoyl-phosphate synthase large subunit
MPRRADLNHVLVIGSGPIVIGQACEFDYSGTQACRVLLSEGIRVSLVNSNPATIMTDPEFADATYVEPITPEFVEKVIAAEHPDALLPTLGGQTALNTAVALYESGVLEKHNVELIGANIEAIRRGEDRQLFKDIVAKAGGQTPRSRVCRSMADVKETVAELGLPVVIRPSFTMGGLGSGMAHTPEQLELLAGAGLAASPVHEVLIEESVLGWKEYELELMRDKHDNVVVICSIENVDPMGVHTGDSVTVAPAMTLTDVEYQAMRDLGIAVLREVGVDTGGCNIQFAVHPGTGRLVVIEMNPRVSRSSALASKATGFPIAKIAAKLAIGYTLDEIPNDITLKTPAAFEPALDYVVVKIPRFAFEKFPGADPELTTTMKSVGEAMSLGRNFPEALNKAMRSMETKAAGFWSSSFEGGDLSVPHDGRLYAIEAALRSGQSVASVAAASGIDPWFVDQVQSLVELRQDIVDAPVLDLTLLKKAKRAGLSDRQLAALRPEFAGEDGVRSLRHRLGVRPVYKTVDTCAAEFSAQTPYHYSTYDEETEVAPSDRAKVIILGSGPNRIGQGIEFDYSCVHAVMALREAGYETVMVNCNPETVSTDYDTADRLYFEPLTFEDVLEVYHAEHTSGVAAGGPGVVGVIVQLGGQTPLGLAQRLKNAGVPIVGTSPESIHLAEERGAFGRVLAAAGLLAPAHGTATSYDDAKLIADTVGYPVLVRPSYVLGGRGMEIVYDDATLRDYIGRATDISPEHPVLVDRFLDDAIEIDVDALCDADGVVYIGGVMEHIEEAGIHSGDSACALPPITLGSPHLQLVRSYTEAIARGVGVQGLLNVQYALKDDALYVLEANPRASRTVPFVSKATAVPLAKAAARIALGATIADLRGEGMLLADGDGGVLPEGAPIAVKEAVLPFKRFRTRAGRGVDTLLSPEMKSTGEVMGIDTSFGYAFAKSQSAAYGSLPTSGKIFVSVANRDKRGMIFPIKRLADLGFEIVATTGTGEVLRRHGIPCEIVSKHYEHPDGRDAVSLIRNGEVQMVINTPQGSGAAARSDGYEIRSAAVEADIPCCTTVPGAAAAVMGVEALIRGDMTVRPLQQLHAALRPELAR